MPDRVRLGLSQRDYQFYYMTSQHVKCSYPNCNSIGLYKHNGLCMWHRRLKRLFPKMYIKGTDKGLSIPKDI